MKRASVVLGVGLVSVVAATAGGPGAELPKALRDRARPSALTRFEIAPQRIVWKSDAGVKNAESLLATHAGQAVLSEPVPPCELSATTNRPAAVLLDFGVELTGDVEIFTPMTPGKEPRRLRVRFGESASEAMAELGEKNAGNDHAVRDQVVTLPWLGKIAVGPSGFRFVRLDAVDPGPPVQLTEVRAILLLRDVPQAGSFRCDDERLNRIWQTGAWTVHLNMQEYLWDGIKRDRLVWIGDMHPETSTICAVFGDNEVVPMSLDLTRDVTPSSKWMNGISSYSIWWVLIHEQWWMHHGRRDYLERQKPYLAELLRRLAGMVGPDGSEKLDGHRFLDWPSSENKPAIHAGLQALLTMCMDSGARMMTTLGDDATAGLCRDAAARLRRHVPPDNGSKQAAALLSLAGLRDPKDAAAALKKDGPAGLSTFYGFYVLEALAKAGETDTALDFIRRFWGAMIDRGATTFWEDFDLAWTNRAGRIDELVPAGLEDLHGDRGAYCYKQFRHSFCHGWASGPTAWLSRHVLGVEPLEPGFKRVRIAPQLGNLRWAEGTYPTPLGSIRVRHERMPDGSIKSDIQAPPGVTVERPRE